MIGQVSLTNAVIAAACGSTVLAAWPGISSLPRSVIGLGLVDRCRDRCDGCFDRDTCGSLAHRCRKHGGCLALRCRGHGSALTDHGVVGSGRAVPGPLPGQPGPGAFAFRDWPLWQADGWDGSGSNGLWSAQWLRPCADPRAILCRTVLWTARAHYPRGTSRVRMNSFRRPVLSSIHVFARMFCTESCWSDR